MLIGIGSCGGGEEPVSSDQTSQVEETTAAAEPTEDAEAKASAEAAEKAEATAKAAEDAEAAKKAESYLTYSAFSRQGLIDQLLYEGFTPEQAEYGVSKTGL